MQMAHMKKKVPEKLMLCHLNPESQARKLGSGFGIYDQPITQPINSPV